MDPAARLGHVRHVAIDLDGTTYKDGRVFAATHRFLEALAELGIGRTFVTNNCSRSTGEYVELLRGARIDVREGDFYSSTHATLDYLRRDMPRVRRLFILGTASLQREFAAKGYEPAGETPGDPPDAVLVGFDTELGFERLCRAAWWISRGKPFIATHPDRVCPTDDETILVDCGSVCAALTEATGKAPVAVPGKPDPRLLEGIMERHGFRREDLAMVGDRLYTDIAMANAAGVLGVLVLTGEADPGDVERADHRPDIVVADLDELVDLLGGTD